MNDEYIKGIGNVVIKFQSLEYLLKTSISELTNIKGIDAYVLTAQMLYSSLIELLKDLSKLKFSKDKIIYEELNELISELKIVQEKRNDIIHSYWFTNFENTEVTKFKMSKTQIVHEFKPYELDNIKLVINQIEEIYYKFNQLILTIMELPKKLQK
jgi:hypothetical protein